MALTPKLLQQGAAGSARANYIEDVFSTYLYTGNSGTQTITNGIDLSGKGGLVWIKNRTDAISHALIDTARGGSQVLSSDTTSAQANYSPQGISAFNSSGFTVNGAATTINSSVGGYTYASWTFREQAKFFDIVTYTGNGSAPRNIAHNLGSVPGCIMIKRTDTTSTWTVYHAGIGNTKALFLNADSAPDTNSAYWNNTTPTSTVFTLGGTFSDINASGGTYVAYLFAHNAGGFGASGSDNVITCGSFTTSAGGVVPNVNLGYEPQWVMIKRTDNTGPWFVIDTMRQWSQTGTAYFYANTTIAEAVWGPGAAGQYFGSPTATGFKGEVNSGVANGTFIYIAIRRGPMKVPTVGTSVFAPATRAGTGAAVTVTGAAFPPDFLFNIDRFVTGPAARYNYDRLRGSGQTDLRTNSTSAEGSAGAIGVSSFNMNGFSIPSTGVSFLNDGAASYINYFFRRAPSFFDVVCYTGTAANRTITHNLTVAPQLVIIKSRSNTNGWVVGSSLSPNVEDYMWLHLTNGWISGTFWNNTRPSSTAISLSDGAAVNASELNFVAYLFATCPGVSKVGSYTGNGSTQTIDCGFAAGARFVLIKRTDSTGDWYIFDTARGIIAGNDPFLKLNTIDAETTSYDAVDPANSGFIVNNDATNFPINVASATYIFLAIA